MTNWRKHMYALEKHKNARGCLKIANSTAPNHDPPNPAERCRPASCGFIPVKQQVFVFDALRHIVRLCLACLYFNAATRLPLEVKYVQRVWRSTCRCYGWTWRPRRGCWSLPRTWRPPTQNPARRTTPTTQTAKKPQLYNLHTIQGFPTYFL